MGVGEGERVVVEGEDEAAGGVGTRRKPIRHAGQHVRRFEAEFLAHMRRSHATTLKDIVETGKLSDDGEKAIAEAVEEFKKQFTTSDGSSAAPSDPDAEALAELLAQDDDPLVHQSADELVLDAI